MKVKMPTENRMAEIMLPLCSLCHCKYDKVSYGKKFTGIGSKWDIKSPGSPE
jgi:hypothetical protein